MEEIQTVLITAGTIAGPMCGLVMYVGRQLNGSIHKLCDQIKLTDQRLIEVEGQLNARINHVVADKASREDWVRETMLLRTSMEKLGQRLAYLAGTRGQPEIMDAGDPHGG